MNEMPANPDPGHIAECLARAVRLILSWPCPQCGQPWPCPCDLAEQPGEPQRQVMSRHTGELSGLAKGRP